jgi:hypothetical protein
MGDVNHRCANNMKKHVHSTTKKREREREGTNKKKEGCCCCCLFQYINSATHRDIYSHIPRNACTSHTFCLFFFPFSLSFAVIYALSLLVGIHRQWVMTRKERGEEVYGCMLDQTLNDERSWKSNPINCTKRKKRRL